MWFPTTGWWVRALPQSAQTRRKLDDDLRRAALIGTRRDRWEILIKLGRVVDVELASKRHPGRVVSLAKHPGVAHTLLERAVPGDDEVATCVCGNAVTHLIAGDNCVHSKLAADRTTGSIVSLGIYPGRAAVLIETLPGHDEAGVGIDRSRCEILTVRRGRIDPEFATDRKACRAIPTPVNSKCTPILKLASPGHDEASILAHRDGRHVLVSCSRGIDLEFSPERHSCGAITLPSVSQGCRALH
jgi:hypothetical protein